MTAPAPLTLVERPPAGPARGAVAAPVWLVVLSTAVLVVLCGLALARGRVRRRRAK